MCKVNNRCNRGYKNRCFLPGGNSTSPSLMFLSLKLDFGGHEPTIMNNAPSWSYNLLLGDTSQTYLLFQTLLLLFWLHSCIIWTKLTRTDVVFSRAISVVFFCADFWIFRYAGKIPKFFIKNQRSGSFRDAK